MLPHITLTLFTNDPVVAYNAVLAGVDRIGLDIEQLNKEERQRGLSSWKSTHVKEDILKLKEIVPSERLFVRTNPLHDNSIEEIEFFLEHNVSFFMLPMFRTAQEISEYCKILDHRAKLIGLLETLDAAKNISSIVAVSGLDELHIGLLDLSLDMGLSHRFAALATPIIENVAYVIHKSGIPFGLAGIGRAQDTSLNINSDYIYAQYARFCATGALISQVFGAKTLSKEDFSKEVKKARERLAYWYRQDAGVIHKKTQQLSSLLSV